MYSRSETTVHSSWLKCLRLAELNTRHSNFCFAPGWNVQVFRVSVYHRQEIARGGFITEPSILNTQILVHFISAFSRRVRGFETSQRTALWFYLQDVPNEQANALNSLEINLRSSPEQPRRTPVTNFCHWNGASTFREIENDYWRGGKK